MTPVELVADAGMQCLRGERIDGDRPPAQVGERTAGNGQVDGAGQANRIYPCTVAVAPSRLTNIVLCVTPVAARTPPVRPMAASCPA